MVYLFAISASFLFTFYVMRYIIFFSEKKGFFDDPKDDKDELKFHKKPTPFLGGLGIYLGFLGAMVICGLSYEESIKIIYILMGGLLLLLLGLFDDIKKVRPGKRFGVQFLVAGLSVYMGLRIKTFPELYISLPLSILLIVGTINAVNLFDGLDGLAGGVVSISLIGLCSLFIFLGNKIDLLISVGLLGAILGFLPYNFSPAKIFMGDNGSTFLGYALAVTAINVSTKPYDLAGIIVPICLIGLPVIDTVFAILRRFIGGKSIFIGDRSHLYDRLVDSGFSVKTTVFICYTIQFIIVISAVYSFIKFS